MTENQNMSQYLGIFLDEGLEQLAALEAEVLRLERGDAPGETLQVLFRAAHTLKGSSRAMGFLEIGDLTHEMESVLDDLRSGSLSVEPEIVTALFQCVDSLKSMMDAVSASGSDAGSGGAAAAELVARLNSLRTGGGKQAASVATAAKSDLSEQEIALVNDADANRLSSYWITVKIQPECPLKSLRRLMVIGALEPAGDLIRSTPEENEIDEATFDGVLVLLFATDRTPEDLKSLISQILEIQSVDIAPYGEPEATATATETAAPPAPSPIAAEAPSPSAAAAAPAAGPASAGAQTIRVGLARLDALLNLVGELVIDRTQIARLANDLRQKHGNDEEVSNLTEAIGRVSRITSELQEEVMKTRMLPIDGVFQRLPRMVRDITQKVGKEIDFQISGGETELDRSVLEYLSDPLIHVLRNSVDHGIERPEERVAAGKPRIGLVSLSARYEESRIVIDVVDDGRGMDPTVIRAAAVKKGLISEAAAAALSDREALNLVTASGFSTASVVSDLSGRGVGMDIVKSNLEKIGGRVSIESSVGVGSRISIILPLTLAIVRALLVMDRGQTYVIPLNNVVEMLHLGHHQSEVTRSSVGGQAVIVARGRTIPLAGLSDLLHGELRSIDPKRIPDDAHVVVVADSDRKVGICVDGVAGEQEVVIKSTGPLLGEISGISGASILGDGKVALIVDIAKAIECIREVSRNAGAHDLIEEELLCA